MSSSIQDNPELSRDPLVWASANGGSSGYISVSGRPYLLRDFTTFLGVAHIGGKKPVRTIELRIHSPFHASHLFGTEDVDLVMSSVPTADCEQVSCHLRTLSPSVESVESRRPSTFVGASSSRTCLKRTSCPFSKATWSMESRFAPLHSGLTRQTGRKAETRIPSLSPWPAVRLKVRSPPPTSTWTSTSSLSKHGTASGSAKHILLLRA